MLKKLFYILLSITILIAQASAAPATRNEVLEIAEAYESLYKYYSEKLSKEKSTCEAKAFQFLLAQNSKLLNKDVRSTLKHQQVDGSPLEFKAMAH